MTATIRRAVLADAGEIGLVHAQAWREAYRGILSDEWIANVSNEERIERWQLILGEPSPIKQWVAEVDGVIIGFSASGPPRDAHPIRRLELRSIYVLSAHAHTGVGRALTTAAIGDAPASVWLLEANHRAELFYTALGFTRDGAHDVITSWENVPEIRMSR